MRRVISLFLPTWPTDRFRRRSGGPPRDEPLVTAATTGARRLVAAADGAAQAEGLRPGLAVAQAQGLVPKLHVVEADPAEDEAALLGLARWAAGYSPLVAVDPPDGLWLDIAGLAHLFGDEAGLFARPRRPPQAPGHRRPRRGRRRAGHRLGRRPLRDDAVVPPGRAVEAVASLPVAALRLIPPSSRRCTPSASTASDSSRRCRGRRSWAPLRRRHRPAPRPGALGQAFEPITLDAGRRFPPAASPSRSRSDGSGSRKVVRRLAERLCRDLARRAEGVRRLDLILRRVDGLSAALRAGTARRPGRGPSRETFDETCAASIPASASRRCA